AQVTILVIDGNQPFDKQDLIIARHVHDEGRAMVIVVNKWDAVEDRPQTLETIQTHLQKTLPYVRGIPVITLSALRKTRLDKLMASVLEVYHLWNRRISTSEMNRWLEAVIDAQPPPLASGRSNRIRYMTQIKTRPPTFSLWCSH